MALQTRPRARSSVEHLFDLVESLEEDQLQSFLEELNSTPDTNIDVSSGVAYFEEQRRVQAHKKQQQLRATPSFINAAPEPADWPRQKPRPVSGSQWRQSMRIVSAPYAKHSLNNSNSYKNGGAGGGADEPVSPPLTASPPGSPPVLPMGGGPPRRSVTAPVGKLDVRVVETRHVAAELSPVSPPRHMLDEEDEDDEEDNSRSAFGAFRFGADGAAEHDNDEAQRSSRGSSTSSDGRSGAVFSSSTSSEQQSRPVSPAQQQQQHHHTVALTPPPEPQQQQVPFPPFSRMGTMPPLLHHAPLSFDAAPIRPSTSAGPLAPRAFRRVSRPVFLSPTDGLGAEELAGRLSAFLFGGDCASSSGTAAAAAAAQRPSTLFGAGNNRSVVMEEMLKEPGMPRGRAVFGKGEDEGVPVSGIFEVLTEG